MTRSGLLLASAALACAACAPSAARRHPQSVIVAEGWAPVEGHGVEEARRAAVADAERRAVEQAAGASIDSTVAVDGGLLARDRIEARVRGVVDGFQVLEERLEAGILRLRLRVRVALDQAPPKPPLATRIELAGGPAQWSSAARDGLRRALVRGGMAPTEAAAPLVVRARADVWPVRDARLAGFQSYRARVSAEALDEGGRIIAARQTEAAALDTDAEPAQDLALALAAEQAGDQLAQELVK